MDTGADRRHLQFYGNEPQLLDGASRTDRAVTDERSRLVVPFRVGIIECILQRRRNAAIVLRAYKDITVEFGDFLLPPLRHLVLGRHPGIDSIFVVEWNRIFMLIE